MWRAAPKHYVGNDYETEQFTASYRVGAVVSDWTADRALAAARASRWANVSVFPLVGSLPQLVGRSRPRDQRLKQDR